MLFFTSDTHFNHANIIKYCNRPFPSIPAMNEELIRRWNERVTSKDTVYHLGDFAMGPDWDANTKHILARLYGEVVLILGNHDRSPTRMRGCGFGKLETQMSLDTQYGKLLLKHAPGFDHDPGPVPEGYDYVLHGHVHNRWKKQGNLINVGVDVWDFYPRTLEELFAS